MAVAAIDAAFNPLTIQVLVEFGTITSGRSTNSRSAVDWAS
jgi:hypothetical protein